MFLVVIALFGLSVYNDSKQELDVLDGRAVRPVPDPVLDRAWF
jgi:hypothetical protein